MKLGAKLSVSASPSALTNLPSEKTEPAAASTPSTSRTRGSSEASKAGGPVSSLAMSVLAVIATSVPFSDSLKISPNDSLIVSVRM